MPLRLYIAGPMTGLLDNNYPAFHAAAERLRAAGYAVENPAENTPPDPNHFNGGTWVQWMRLALRQMLTCDGVALLSGWHQSQGAKIEARTARDVGLPVMMVGGWVRALEGEERAA